MTAIFVAWYPRWRNAPRVVADRITPNGQRAGLDERRTAICDYAEKIMSRSNRNR